MPEARQKVPAAPASPTVFLARTPRQILACLPVLHELRPHVPRQDFVARIQRQQASGYLLAACQHRRQIVAAAGYRLLENLAWGRFLYVDDLVTLASARSMGYGQILMKWLIVEAHAHHCAELHLDSGVQRFGAHRFYLGQRLDITCHHFAIKLPDRS